MNDRPDIVIMPPLAAVIGLALCAALNFVFKLWIIPEWGNMLGILPGIALVVGGFTLAYSAAAKFQDADTNVDPTKPSLIVVTDGPYRFSRNPMYLGLLAVHFGFGLVFSLDWTVVVTPLLWATLHFGVVLREEAYLIGKFGTEYEALLKRTRRWI